MRGRRGRGEGSISQRRDGRWMARVDLGWYEGRRRYKAVYGHTRREVADKLTKLLRDTQQGIPLGDDRQTLRQYLDHWLAAITNSVRPKTLRSYTQLVRLHVIPGLGHIPLTKLQPEEVEAFLEVKRQAGLSPRTRQYLRTVLRIALNRAMRHGLLARNVAALAAPPRGTRPEVKSLSPEQARTFLVSIASHRLYALFAVAVSCGLRQGEILGLCWSDVDLDQGALRVRQALERLGKGWRFVEPKSVTSRRTITLPHTVVPILRAHRTQQCAQRLAAGARWTEHGFVFTACHGQPLDGCRLNATTKRLMAAAGLPTLPFHSLRHSAATILLVQGVPPRVVMEVLGHSDVRLTLGTYSHVVAQLQAEAASQMDAALWAVSR